MRVFRQTWPLAALALLAGCGGSGVPVTSIPAPPPRRAPAAPPVRVLPRHVPPRYVPPPAQIQALPVPGVIGATAADLARQFGPPRLDVLEGDARKLQYSGPACVLDVYLYPPATGREPQATYVDARRASDGQDVDRTACIAALRQGGVTRP